MAGDEMFEWLAQELAQERMELDPWQADFWDSDDNGWDVYLWSLIILGFGLLIISLFWMIVY